MNKHYALKVYFLFLISTFLFACRETPNDTKFEGIVVNETTGQPIPGVSVGFYCYNIFNHTIIGKTDNNGHFKLEFTYSSSNDNMDYIDIGLIPYREVISESVSSQQIETHDFICLDTVNNSTSYRIYGSGDYQYEFKVTPQAILQLDVFASPSLDIDSLILLFPNALCCVEKRKILKQYITDCGGTSRIFGTKFTTLGDMDFEFNYLGYKNGSVVLQDSVSIFMERFRTKSYSYTIQ